MNTMTISNESTFIKNEIHGISDVPNFSGERITALDGSLVYSISPPGMALFKPTEHLAMVILGAVHDVEWSLGPNRTHLFDAPAGTVLVFPAKSETMLRWPMPKESILITLMPERLGSLRELSIDLRDTDPFPVAVRNVDPKCLQVAQLLRGELQKQERINERYVDALLTVTTTLLLRNHSALEKRGERKDSGCLSHQAARLIEAHLRENFSRKISISEMAALVGISPGHFLTTFRESFGQTPHQYLLMLRLNEAEKYLRESDMPLATIAEMIGFSSQSHMTTALKKNKCATPGEIRRRRVFLRAPVHETHALNNEVHC